MQAVVTAPVGAGAACPELEREVEGIRKIRCFHLFFCSASVMSSHL